MTEEWKLHCRNNPILAEIPEAIDPVFRYQPWGEDGKKLHPMIYINMSDTTKSRKRGKFSLYDYEDMVCLKIYLVRGNYECNVKKFSYDPIIWFYQTPDIP